MKTTLLYKLATVLLVVLFFSSNPLFVSAEFNAKFFVTQDNVVQPVIHADEFSGALIHSIPVVIPPGRNGLQPDVSLQYNNQRNNNSNIVGYGWDIPTPAIQRVSKSGTENIYTDLNFTSSFDGELSFISSTTVRSEYGPRFTSSDGKEYAYFSSDSAWQATDQSGTVYIFGSTTAARQDDPNDSSKIYKWLLQEIRDKNNNYVSYTYTKDSGQIYPSTITYTGNGTTDGDFQISFGTESRSDYLASYESAFSVESRYRVNQILVKIDGVWVRKYDLAYTTGANGVRTLLSSVTETGKDKDGNTVALPAISFSYQTGNVGWSIDPVWDSPVDFIKSNGGGDSSVRFAEINGDGLIDMWQAYDNAIGGSDCDTKNSWTNIGSGWSTTGKHSPECFRQEPASIDDTAVRLGDFNSDGLTDIVRSFQQSASTTEHFYLNRRDGAEFEEPGGWDIPGYFYDPASGYTQYFLEDVNTDGMADFVASNVYLFNSTTTGWSAISGIYGGTGTEPQDPAGATFADINGDGLVDRIVSAFQSGSENIQEVYLNTGTGFTKVSTTTIPLYFYDAPGRDLGVRVVDVNNDGLPDFIQGNKDNSDVSYYRVFVNAATSTPNWIYDPSLSSVLPTIYFTRWLTSTYVDGGWRALDVNGDSLTDFVGTYYYADPGGPIRTETHINTGNRADTLSQVTTAEGGTISFGYRSSADFKDGGSKLVNTEAPSVVMVIATTTYNDGFSTPWSETKEYEGAYYFYNGEADRFFAGFHIATSTDGVGNKTVTYFHQGTSTNSTFGEYNDDISKHGKPYRTEEKDASGNIFSKTLHKWDMAELGAGRTFVKLIQSLFFSYDGDSDHKDKAETFTYDDTTRLLTQKTEWGEATSTDSGTFTDSVSDKRYTDFTYASSTAIRGLIAEEITKNNASTTVKDIKHYYDDLSLWNVLKGNETKREEWVSGSTYIDFEKTYNSFGLMTQEKDPRDKITTISYEAKNIHAATTTDPANLVTERYFDYSSGKVQKLVDQNGRAFETVYDGLDRATTEKIPDPDSPASLVTKKTIAYTDTAGSRKTVETNFLNAATSTEAYVYLDGFNRKLQERREAEDTNVFSVRDFEYNALGLVSRESLPYFSSGSAKGATTTESNLYTTYAYDALKRITNVLNAVGSTTKAYDDWTETVIDPLNNTKQFIRDAFGRLTSVIEHDDGSQYSTNYDYNARNDLTALTDSLANVRNFTYDGLSRLTNSQDLHDALDISFASTTYAYDASGNVTQKIDGKNQTVNFTYDDINRVLTEDYTDLVGTEIEYGYDTCSEGKGRLCAATTTDAVVNLAYNSLGNIINETKKIQATSYQLTHSYDWQGNLTGVTYPDNANLSSVFNAAGLLERLTLFDNASTTNILTNINYSPTGQVNARIFGNGDVSLLTYDEDELYRLRSILTLTGTTTAFDGTNPVSTAGALDPQKDGAMLAGNLTDMMGEAGTVTVGFRYGLLLDDDDEYTATTSTMTATSTGPFTIELLGLDAFKDYSYEAFVSTSSTAVYYGGRHRFYTADLTRSYPTYKEHNRAWVLTNYDDGTHASTTVDGNKLKLYNFGSTSTPQYESGYWLSDPWDLSSITNVEDSFIEYCACARNGADVKVKTAITTSTSTTPSASDFAYATSSQSLPNVLAGDNLYGKYLWLKIEMEPNWGATSTPCLCRINLAINNVGTTTSAHNALQNIQYTYDASGNITQIEDYSGFGGNKTVNYTYDDLYRMLTASTTAPSDGGYKETYTYDRLGNILTGPQGSYTYAETGFANPHAVTSLGGSTLTYDNNGNVTAHGSNTYEWNYRDRLTKSVVGGVSTFYGYDFNNDRVTKGNGTATTTYASRWYETTSATTTKYIFDNNGVLLATIEGTGTATSTRFVHGDHLNSTTITTDEDGDVLSSKDYLPFGSERVSTGEQVGRTFIGEYGDAETDLSYLNARYYQNDRGQFISQDPVFLHTGTTLQNQKGLNSMSGSNWSQNTPSSYRSTSGMGRNGGISQEQLAWLSDPQQQNSARTMGGLNSGFASGWSQNTQSRGNSISQAEYLADPQLQNSYSYARGNPIRYSDPTGEIPILPIFAAYGAIQMAIHAYEAKTVFIDYPDVFTPQEKYQTGFNLGLDAVLFGAGKAAKDIGQRAVLEVGPAILDVMDHYFGEQIYKNVNNNNTQTKPDSSNNGGGSGSNTQTDNKNKKR